MSKHRKVLRVGITIGDANGVGPELVIQAFQDPRLKEMFTPIVYGSTRVLNIFRKVLSVEKFSYNIIESPAQAQPRKVSVVDCGEEIDRVDIGKPDPEGGKIAFASLEAAVKDLKDGELDVLVTLPIDKSTIQSDSFRFPGHTEYLAEVFGVKENLMLMVHEHIRVAVVTGHVPLKEVSNNLSIHKIVNKIKLLDDTLRRDFDIQKPKIAVLGVNPHAGDEGLLGKEDREYVAKAVQQASKDGVFVFGPFSADGFFGMGTFKRFDAVLAMYHDQGLIPFKLLAGLEGVNYTAGMPVIRTSPDHGVAYDIAGKGIADPASFIQAIYIGMDIYRRRAESDDLEKWSLANSGNVPAIVEGEDEDVPLEESAD